MTVGYKAIRETFTTQVLLNPEEHAIDVKYIDGPFRYLDNRWRFEPAGDGGCAVDFFIDYEFKSRILGAVMGSMFDRAFRMFAEAFETARRQDLRGSVLSEFRRAFRSAVLTVASRTPSRPISP